MWFLPSGNPHLETSTPGTFLQLARLKDSFFTVQNDQNKFITSLLNGMLCYITLWRCRYLLTGAEEADPVAHPLPQDGAGRGLQPCQVFGTQRSRLHHWRETKILQTRNEIFEMLLAFSIECRFPPSLIVPYDKYTQVSTIQYLDRSIWTYWE